MSKHEPSPARPADGYSPLGDSPGYGDPIGPEEIPPPFDTPDVQRPTAYPRNGASGVCRCGRDVGFVCGTNGPGPGTWWHQDDDTACPATPGR
jgi:hypothetical protein